MCPEIDLSQATELHIRDEGSRDDDDWKTETLHRLPNGRYALRTETGMNHDESGACYTTRLSEAAAKTWLTKHAGAAAARKLFAAPAPTRKKKPAARALR